MNNEYNDYMYIRVSLIKWLADEDAEVAQAAIKTAEKIRNNQIDYDDKEIFKEYYKNYKLVTGVKK